MCGWRQRHTEEWDIQLGFSGGNTCEAGRQEGSEDNMFCHLWGLTSRKAAIYFGSLVHLIRRGDNEKRAIRRGWSFNVRLLVWNCALGQNTHCINASVCTTLQHVHAHTYTHTLAQKTHTRAETLRPVVSVKYSSCTNTSPHIHYIRHWFRCSQSMTNESKEWLKDL